MDWNAAIERNREALKRVLAMLVAMAALPVLRAGGGAGITSPTLPRHLHRAVLRLLRPAEAAARRLVIVAARGIVITVSPGREPMQAAGPTPSPSSLRAATSPPLREGEDRSLAWHLSSPPGTGGEVARAARRREGTLDHLPGHSSRRAMAACQNSSVQRLGFPLFDPLHRFRRARPARNGVPRISFPGFSEPFPIPRSPSADDPVDAERLALRLAALGRVLNDLPREARRFARWRCGNIASAQIDEARRLPLGRSGVRRVWPLRPGRPPGHRPANRGPLHEVHDILDVMHGLAFWALEAPDTS